jgi:DNA-binding GntR family transcriptional regulator
MADTTLAFLGRTGAAIPRLSLHEEIVGRLRAMIIDGTLAPGEWIVEPALCRELAISRTPLREALKVLASENLITLLPNRGARVSEIVQQDIADVFEVMGALERLVGLLAAQRASDAAIAALQVMHRALAGHHANGRRHEYFDLNQAIHLRIAELGGNPTLAAAYAGFAAKVRRARFRANLSSVRWAESIAEHETFMAALAERDAERFATLLEEHSRHTGTVVCQALGRE